MRTFIVLALAIAVSNSSFLRNLEAEVTVNEITYTTKCFGQTTGGNLEVTIKVGGENTNLKTVGGLTATFSEGTATNDIKIDIENDPSSPTIQKEKEVTLTETIAANHACGTYTLKELVDTTKDAQDKTTPAPVYTFKLPEKQTTSFKIVTDVPVATTGQTASQEVDEEDTTKNTFIVLFSADLAAAPFMFAGNDMTKVIADCKVDTTDKKKLTCTPTKDELKEGENEIYYQKGCATTAEKTGVKVTFTPEEASTFMRHSKIALLIFAFIL